MPEKFENRLPVPTFKERGIPRTEHLPAGIPCGGLFAPIGCRSFPLLLKYSSAPVLRAHCRVPDLESKTRGTSSLNMGKRYYVAVHTDSDCVCCCNHKHPNVSTATACISDPGGYVVAIRRRKMLQLTETEEVEFQKAMYGRTEPVKHVPDLALLLSRKLKTQS